MNESMLNEVLEVCRVRFYTSHTSQPVPDLKLSMENRVDSGAFGHCYPNCLREFRRISAMTDYKDHVIIRANTGTVLGLYLFNARHLQGNITIYLPIKF